VVEYYEPKPAKKKPLNGAQFSQMGLFEQPKPSAEHRWPLGYTPERKAQVSQQLAGSKVTVEPQSKYVTSDVFKSRGEIAKASMTAGRGEPSAMRNARARSAHARGVLTDIIARSSAPIEDLRGAPGFEIRSTATRGGGYFSPHAGKPARIQINPARQGSQPRQRQRIEKTVMHELGHHADYLRLGAGEFVSRSHQRIPTLGTWASPSLEGAAEGYAFGHHIARRGEEAEPYHKVASYTGFHSIPAFRERFEEISGTPLEAAMAKPEHLGEQFDPKAPSQPRLFGRAADVSMTSTQREHGQWGYFHHPEGKETPLGTIKVGRGAPETPEYLPGFRPGDEEVVHDLQRGAFWGHESATRERVAREWNKKNPKEPLRHRTNM
jgi:hypothetical protein